MRSQLSKTFPATVGALIFLSAAALAGGHHSLNGTWTLVPERSDFAGQPPIQSGTVVINDREHNITVSRSFTYDGADQSLTYSFTTDGRENASIREGKTFKSKAKWEGDTLKVTTLQEGMTTTEQFSARPGDSLMLVVDRDGHGPETLFFQRR